MSHQSRNTLQSIVPQTIANVQFPHIMEIYQIDGQGKNNNKSKYRTI